MSTILKNEAICFNERVRQGKLIENQSRETNTYINAHISNISFPKSLEELDEYISIGKYNTEDILYYESVNWTVPRTSKKGDIVLFFHAKTAIQWIRKLETATRKLSDNNKQALYFNWLNRARNIYNTIGGKIFAIGRIINSPDKFYDPNDAIFHYNGRDYAEINDIALLDIPIDIGEFNIFLTISRQSGITIIPSNEYNKLKELIVLKNNNLPKYFLNSYVGNYEFNGINRHNYLIKTAPYRRRFLLEADFRSNYVDFLLKNTTEKFYRECNCRTYNSKTIYYADNVILIEGKYYFLEVKINIYLQPNLINQLKQYTNSDYLYLDNNSTSKIIDYERNYIFVIDTECLYVYEVNNNKLIKLIDLDDLRNNINPFLEYINNGTNLNN